MTVDPEIAARIPKLWRRASPAPITRRGQGRRSIRTTSARSQSGSWRCRYIGNPGGGSRSSRGRRSLFFGGGDDVGIGAI